MAVATSRSRSGFSVTEPWTAVAPSASATAAAEAPRDISTRAWPRAASARAQAAPMPPPAAVTMATGCELMSAS